MTYPHARPNLILPTQARPVHRDSHDAPGTTPEQGGAEAARSRCASLPGMARQMCYAALYGIRI
ncbi:MULTISPECIES: hypothetical protein [Streptomyces]|uniref:hypothetical protein n=1 Tax=Streptomyces nigra TaxID=1827580 RepID=UPI003676C923